MRRALLLRRALVAVAGLAGLGGLAGPASAGPASTAVAAAVEVELEDTRHSATVGERFTVGARVTNPGSASTDSLIAHLNVASLTSDVYVDPEDWSSERTMEVGTLPAGGTADLTWEMQAVNSGTFAVYVVVLPTGATAGAGALAVSPAVTVRVAGRRALNAGGALPVVLAVPLLLAAAAAVTRVRLRRSR